MVQSSFRAFIPYVFHIFAGIFLIATSLRFLFVFTTDINWDEFYFLANVYEFKRAELDRPLQTLHVHAFTWLSQVSLNEVNQIAAARILMFAASLVTAFLIYRLCLRFASPAAAMVALACYTAFSFVMEHASSFRTDPIITACTMGAIYIALTGGWHAGRFALLGALLGIAGLISIKAVFMVPVIGCILLVRLFYTDRKPAAFAVCLGAFFSALASFAALYFLHKSTLSAQSDTAGVEIVSHGIQKTLLAGDLFPQVSILLPALASNFVISAAMVCGVWIVLIRLARGEAGPSGQGLQLLCLGLPILTLIFYRNSFPYFYPFILAPAAVFIAIAADAYLNGPVKKPWGPKYLGYFLLILAIQVGVSVSKNLKRTTETQTATLQTVHQMFPEPVAYIDRNSMVSSFPKKGLFMSSWGLENYHTAGTPIFADIIRQDRPQFLIANIETLDLNHPERIANLPAQRRLLPEDLDMLSRTFIHHWGKIYVPGKRFANLSPSESQTFDLVMEGIYTLESTHPVRIDGEFVNPGDQIFLNQGSHILAGTKPDTHVALRWGRNLFIPDNQAPKAPIYFGF